MSDSHCFLVCHLLILLKHHHDPFSLVGWCNTGLDGKLQQYDLPKALMPQLKAMTIASMQMGIRALQMSGKQYKVQGFLAEAANLVPDLIKPIAKLEAEANKAHEGSKSMFDSTMSLDDLPDC